MSSGGGGIVLKISGLVVRTLAKPVGRQLKADAEHATRRADVPRCIFFLRAAWSLSLIHI